MISQSLGRENVISLPQFGISWRLVLWCVLLILTVKNINSVGLTFCHILVSFRYKS